MIELGVVSVETKEIQCGTSLDGVTKNRDTGGQVDGKLFDGVSY